MKIKLIFDYYTLSTQANIHQFNHSALAMRKIVLASAITGLAFLQSVSAHGGEETEGLTNLQIMLASLSACIIFHFSSAKFFPKEYHSNRKYLLTLVMFTGLVHILLGIKDIIFLAGGLGVISIISVSAFTEFGRTRDVLLMTMLGGVVITMFVAYFTSNHDLHYIAEDYLGVTTKIAELGIIWLLVKQYRNLQKIQTN